MSEGTADSVMKKGRNVAKTIVHFGSPLGTTYGDTKKIIIVKEKEMEKHGQV
jgi:hypothetical protein